MSSGVLEQPTMTKAAAKHSVAGTRDNPIRRILDVPEQLFQLIISTAPESELPDPPLEEGGDASDDAEVRLLHIDATLHGQRIDRALATGVHEFSRSYLQQRIEAGDVLLGGQTVSKASAKVRQGQSVQITLRATPQSRAFVPQEMPIETIYVDEHLRVVHKPAGCVVHPAPGNWQGTLLNGLLALDPAVQDLPRAGIVHRLDKDTSGLMVVARTRAAMDALVRMIAAREVSRQYLAIGHRGWPIEGVREVQAAIGRDPGNRLRMAVVDLTRLPGKTARTSFECLDSNERACLVHCVLHTGRTHQIRVHMAHIGHSLLADPLYGGKFEAGLTRQALHAWRLAFVHPFTGQKLAWTVDLPKDMQQALTDLGLHGEPPTWASDTMA
jgi:23S rRNA pseudouridine1911/1915/1917 synthase